MPLTALESPPETNVEDILAVPVAWAVAQVRPNYEKVFVQALPDNFPYVLPYVSYENASRHTTLRPLFPGYVFIGEFRGQFPSRKAVPATPRAYSAARSTRCCNSPLLYIGNQQTLRLQLALLTSSSPETRRLEPEIVLRKNERVQFTHSSPYWGLTGHIERWEMNSQKVVRIFIRVETMGRVVSVETTMDKLTRS